MQKKKNNGGFKFYLLMGAIRRVFIHLAGNLKTFVLIVVAGAAMVAVTAASAHVHRRELGQNLPEISTKLSSGMFGCGEIEVIANGPIEPKSPCE